ncbi:uncharacterized protein LOC112348464 [Selaginella moellendorffii]|uniref:uncharacterized protein LOC112348464 n=1 Tax=Selaginella moellendorffii TaxID=88036 RepID=UPI000D1CF0F3|nr:uncharacterized protein LOC112348464 [Selaginella moellendorffii]|eukprot:XP_024536779.1 uncharacterized protein LOC112348464 [Selaginella moellendorffii]
MACGEDDLPDDVLARILSLIVSSRHLYWCSLVSKRWARLAKLVTHFSLEDEQYGFLSWFDSSASNLRSLSVHSAPRSSLGWLPAIGKTLHSLTISVDVDGFWSSIVACQQLRCLHIINDVKLGGAITTTTAAAPMLPSLIYCVMLTGLDVGTMQQLLALCPSLVYIQLMLLLVESPGTYLLKSHSLDCLALRGKSVANFSLALDMPKLRWMFVSAVPRLELRLELLPSTCNVEWIKPHTGVRIIQGLRMSKLNKLTFTNTCQSAADVTQILKRFVCQPSAVSGITRLDLFVKSSIFDPGSLNLAQLLEPFPALEVFTLSHSSIKCLSLDKWSSREAPLCVRIEVACGIAGWARDEISFVRELVESSSCVTRLDVSGVVYATKKPPKFRTQIPRAIVKLGEEFSGRVKVHPIRFVPRRCDVIWRCMKAKFDSEAPYTAIHHRCTYFDDTTEVCV